MSRIATICFFDIRNSTKSIKEIKEGKYRNEFYKKFYSFPSQALIHLNRKGVSTERVFFSSTGDGALVIFIPPKNDDLSDVRTSFLFSLMCRQYYTWFFEEVNKAFDISSSPLDFGMAFHRGNVTQINGPRLRDEKVTFEGTLDTYIGDDINIAARSESSNSTHFRTRVSFTEDYVDRLIFLIDGDNNTIKKLVKKRIKLDAGINAEDEQKRQDLDNKMYSKCSKAGLVYLGYHKFKGVDAPINMYRLSEGRVGLVDIKTGERIENEFIRKTIKIVAGTKINVNQLKDWISKKYDPIKR